MNEKAVPTILEREGSLSADLKKEQYLHAEVETYSEFLCYEDEIAIWVLLLGPRLALLSLHRRYRWRISAHIVHRLASRQST